MKIGLLKHREKITEFIRFCLVGCIAASIHYGIYYIIQYYLLCYIELALEHLIPCVQFNYDFLLSIAYTVGYLISLVCNFFMTTYYTFHSDTSAKKAVGFGFSHVINYTIHLVLFNSFLAIGIHRLIVPILVLLVAVPTNFLILRFVYKSKK